MPLLETTVKTTGEVVGVEIGSPEKLIEGYMYVNEVMKAWETIKKQLQDQAREIVGTDGTYEHAGYRLRVSNVQRQAYDKTLLRAAIQDEDLLNDLMEPNKAAVDRYVKDNLVELGDTAAAIRAALVPSGQPYGVVKLEKVK